MSRPHPKDLPSWKSPARRTAAEALAHLVETEGAGAASQIAAEVLSGPYRESFAQAYGLKPCRGRLCIQRLLGKTHRYPGRRGEDGCVCTPPHDDHPSLWRRGGKPAVWVSQPYPMPLPDLQEMFRFGEEFGLKVELDTWPSWHAPGQVLTVLFIAPGVELRRESTPKKGGRR